VRVPSNIVADEGLSLLHGKNLGRPGAVGVNSPFSINTAKKLLTIMANRKLDISVMNLTNFLFWKMDRGIVKQTEL
jgi:hypothetical protein